MRRAVACRVVSHVRGPLVAPHVRSLSTFTAPPPTPARPGPGWRNAGWAAAALGAAAAAVGQSVVYADGLVKPLPVYTRAQVAEHATKAAGIWVTYKDSVYDITEFVANHPGGSDKIMMAAGAAIDPFWNLYRQHLNSPTPAQILAEMKIGTLDPNEAPLPVDESNPYAKDPPRHPGLHFHSKQPCNAELPLTLMDSWITPTDLFFVRHHHPVPAVDAASFRLLVSAPGVPPTSFSLLELQSKFKHHTVAATLQCGGNRRGGMNQVAKTSGTAWGCGAISTAQWTGVSVRDVLVAAGLSDPEAAGVAHVSFVAADDMRASVPVEKVFNPYGDVLLAWDMNGAPLPADHGAPLRAIVPGHVGVRNVKWVKELHASDVEAEGMWQRGMAYKMFPSSLKSLDGVDVESKVSMQEQPVQSAIIEPRAGSVVEGDSIDVKGYAWSGGGRGIVLVDVSIDGGATWVPATLDEGSEQKPNRAWAWTLWSAEVPVPVGLDKVEVCCRATDAASNTQPPTAAPIWNMRGLANNSWHTVAVTMDR